MYCVTCWCDEVQVSRPQASTIEQPCRNTIIAADVVTALRRPNGSQRPAASPLVAPHSGHQASTYSWAAPLVRRQPQPAICGVRRALQPLGSQHSGGKCSSVLVPEVGLHALPPLLQVDCTVRASPLRTAPGHARCRFTVYSNNTIHTQHLQPPCCPCISPRA